MKTEKSFFLHLVLFLPLFFIRQNVKVSVVHGNACRVVHGFMSDASIRSGTLSCASLRPTAAKGCTSEYFNCANSSCCTVSELVMCIKPSAERCLLLVWIYFLPSLSLHLLLFRLSFFLEEIAVERGVVIFCAVCSTQFYLLFISFHCFVLLLLFKIIFH